MKKSIIIIIIIVAVTLVGYFLFKSDPQTSGTADKQNQSLLPQAPGSSQLTDNLKKAGLDALSAEGTVLHIHQHLDIFINGEIATIPANIGIANFFISPIHTHDTSGIIHVESPVQKDFKLSQFFQEWGVNLTNDCLSTYCETPDNHFVAAVNGQPVQDIQNYILKAHDEIELWYGPKTTTPEFIKSYTFPSGL